MVWTWVIAELGLTLVAVALTFLYLCPSSLLAFSLVSIYSSSATKVNTQTMRRLSGFRGELVYNDSLTLDDNVRLIDTGAL